MQMAIAAAVAIVVNAAYVSKNSEVTDAGAIQAFMADPDTHAFNVRDPTAWSSYRKVLQLGSKQPDGSCKYPLGISTPGNYVSFATEIAVNKVRCQSLIIEGNPGSAVQERVQIPTGIAEAPIATAAAAPAQAPATTSAVTVVSTSTPAPQAVAAITHPDVAAQRPIYSGLSPVMGLKLSYVLASLSP